MDERVLRLAVPNKGRLRDSTARLLREAGLIFEQTERALSVRVRNVALDLLFVRTEDVVELVADETADLGITGLDVTYEADRSLEVLLPLGYGRCELTLAAPADHDYEKPEDFAGLTIATSHPTLTKAFFADRGIEVTVVQLRGSVEVAPKLGVADAIVDLVSTGSTLMVNGLKPVMPILSSEAILLANKPAMELRAKEISRVATALNSVVAGRSKRYLLLNAPKSFLDSIIAIIPGLESPTVIPLAEEGVVAVHSVVSADDVWGLLPDLKEAGGRDILVLPIGQLVP